MEWVIIVNKSKSGENRFYILSNIYLENGRKDFLKSQHLTISNYLIYFNHTIESFKSFIFVVF